jgi:hypothetical protein
MPGFNRVKIRYFKMTKISIKMIVLCRIKKMNAAFCSKRTVWTADAGRKRGATATVALQGLSQTEI